MIIKSGTYVSFESSATVEPRQRISNIYIYLYVSDQTVFIGSEVTGLIKFFHTSAQMGISSIKCVLEEF